MVNETPVDFAHAIGTLDKRRFPSQARFQDLVRTSPSWRLVKLDFWVNDANGFENFGHAEGGELAGQNRLAPAVSAIKRHGGQVIDPSFESSTA